MPEFKDQRKELLTQKETDLLEDIVQRVSKTTLLFGAGIFIMFSVFILMGVPYTWMSLSIAFSILLLFVLAFVLAAGQKARLCAKDLKHGYKLVIRGELTGKFTREVKTGSGIENTETNYFFVVDGKKIKADRNSYNSVEKGTLVVIEKAPFSHTIFSVRSI